MAGLREKAVPGHLGELTSASGGGAGGKSRDSPCLTLVTESHSLGTMPSSGSLLTSFLIHPHSPLNPITQQWPQP